MKEKVIILQCIDCTNDEAMEIRNELKASKIKNYEIFVTNMKVNAIPKDEFLKAIEELKQC